MALPARSQDKIIDLDRNGLDTYFERYARYIPDSPGKCYGIRIGTHTLLSNDTYELKKAFIRAVATAKAMRTKQQKKGQPTNRKI